MIDSVPVFSFGTYANCARAVQLKAASAATTAQRVLFNAFICSPCSNGFATLGCQPLAALDVFRAHVFGDASAVRQSVDVTVTGGDREPRVSLGEILLDARAVLVRAREIQLGDAYAGIGRAAKPACCLGRVFLHTAAQFVENAQFSLRFGMLLIGGAPQPVRRRL